jgi:hypothetical protein
LLIDRLPNVATPPDATAVAVLPESMLVGVTDTLDWDKLSGT